MDFDQPPVVRVSVGGDHDLDPEDWPMTVPAVAQIVRDALDLGRGVTFLVGENGSGSRRWWRAARWPTGCRRRAAAGTRVTPPVRRSRRWAAS
ncbi:MAG: hypothetical protein ABWZ91_02825 [Nocardioides sp.]